MSCNYAEGLSDYNDKGVIGIDEKFDTSDTVAKKCKQLSDWLKESKHTVFHTGAGISTSVGIPDFRGPKGVWTLEKEGQKPTVNISFDDAKPSQTHMALIGLMNTGYAHYIISQNIDGLHLKSGVPRAKISELHGNMFTEQCTNCNKQVTRRHCVQTVGQKSLNKPCMNLKNSKLPCRGKMFDTILDWEHNLPENDLLFGEYHSKQADLSICLGTTLQINPSGTLPLLTQKTGGKLVIINLQPTKYDKKADLVINTYVDDVFTHLMSNLRLEIPAYNPASDPTKQMPQDWTTPNAERFLKKYKPKEIIRKKRKSHKVEQENKKRQHIHLSKKREISEIVCFGDSDGS